MEINSTEQNQDLSPITNNNINSVQKDSIKVDNKPEKFNKDNLLIKYKKSRYKPAFLSNIDM